MNHAALMPDVLRYTSQRRLTLHLGQDQLGMYVLTKAEFSLTHGDFVESITCLTRRTLLVRSSCPRYWNQPHNPMRYMERYNTLRDARNPVNFPFISAVYEKEVWLTNEMNWHIKKWSVSRCNKQYLGDIPLFSPDMFHFAIEEEEPVIYLVIENQRSEDHPKCM